MEIKNKEDFKVRLKLEIAKHIKHFPFYFYFNIIINLIILAAIIAVGLLLAFILGVPDARMGEAFVYGLLFLAFLLSVFSITIRSFFKSVRILKAIQAGHYDVDIEDYELDNVLQFLEQLPMKKQEVEKMKIELSFGKLINVLDLFGIINCEEETYDIDLIFKRNTEESSKDNNEEAAVIIEEK